MAKKSEIKKQRNLKDFDDPDAEARIQRVLKETGGHLSIPNPQYPPPPPDTRPLEERTIGKCINHQDDAAVKPEVRRSKRIAKVEEDKAVNKEVKVEGRGVAEVGSKRKSRNPTGKVDQKKPVPQTPAPRTPASQTHGKGKSTMPAKPKKK
jgi:hypothetical protein